MQTTRITARWTAAAYLALATTGVAGFLIVRPRLVVEDDPAASFALLTANPSLVQLGTVLRRASEDQRCHAGNGRYMKASGILEGMAARAGA